MHIERDDDALCVTTGKPRVAIRLGNNFVASGRKAYATQIAPFAELFRPRICIITACVCKYECDRQFANRICFIMPALLSAKLLLDPIQSAHQHVRCARALCSMKCKQIFREWARLQCGDCSSETVPEDQSIQHSTNVCLS